MIAWWIGIIIFAVGLVWWIIELVKIIKNKRVDNNNLLIAVIVLNSGNLIMQIALLVMKICGGN